MDETGIYDNMVAPRSYVCQSSNAYVKTQGTGRRDTIVTTLRGDGFKFPLYFIETQRQRKQKGIIVKNAQKGMTKSLMIDYIEKIIKPNVKGNELFIMDALSSHKNVEVIKKLESLGLKVLILPPKTASFVSPLDNSFFHQFKHLYKTQTFFLSKNFEERKATAIIAYEQVLQQQIQNYFRRCELIFSNSNE